MREKQTKLKTELAAALGQVRALSPPVVEGGGLTSGGVGGELAVAAETRRLVSQLTREAAEAASEPA